MLLFIDCSDWCIVISESLTTFGQMFFINKKSGKCTGQYAVVHNAVEMEHFVRFVKKFMQLNGE